MGSSIRTWKRLAGAGKYLKSKLGLLKEKSIVQRNAFISIGRLVLQDSSTRLLKKTRLGLGKVINLGTVVWQEREYVNQTLGQSRKVKGLAQLQNSNLGKPLVQKTLNGKATMLDTVRYMVGFVGDLEEQRSVNTAVSRADVLNGLIKAMSTKEMWMTGWNYARGVITNTIKLITEKQQYYGI